jgi:hypothetical protein
VELGLLREECRLRVFENGVLRRIFEHKMDKVTGELRKLHSEDLHILYLYPNIIIHIKSRRMRWVGHVARVGEERNFIKFWWESSNERDHLEGRGRMGSE